jgi:hyperosmotically inducible periplasmic protein
MSRIVHLIVVSILILDISSFAQTPKTQTPAPDNTKINERDRNTARPTADQQKENRSDLEITREIRRSITQDKALSTYAKNVKIITKDGGVTLKGPVRSEEEKKVIETKANDVAGATHVKSELEVAAKQTGKKNR